MKSIGLGRIGKTMSAVLLVISRILSIRIMELSKTTKIASAVTIAALIVARAIFPQFFFFVPIAILFGMMILYPGCEKIGIRGMAAYLQAGYAVTAISVIAILVMI